MPKGILPLAAPLAVLAAVLMGLLPLLLFASGAGSGFGVDGYVLRILRFTLLQASLSALLSIVPGLLVARALARQGFPGRNLLVSLFGVPLSLPVIVAVLGLATLYGRNGWLGGTFPLYGLGGILLAHVFFNLPLATRFFLETLEAVPPESHRLAAQLGFNGFATWRLIDWPVLRASVPRVAALIFLICAASFVIVLTLGGPSATTLEVAIYQSLRMDFDVPRALSLSLVQLVLSGFLVLAAGRLAFNAPISAPLRQQRQRWDGQSASTRIADAVVIALAMLLVLPPMLAIAANGLLHITINQLFLQAALSSFLISFVSAAISLVLGWPIAALQLRRGAIASLASLAALGGLIVPPAVMATGWFLSLRSIDGGLPLAIILVAMLNALMALPFVTTVLGPAIAQNAQAHDRLCSQLGIRGLSRLRLVDFPTLRPAVLQALLMALVLSLGDLTAITLFGSQGLVTLPSLVSQQMGNYRSLDAGGTALMLALLTFTLTLLAQRLRRIS